MKGLEPGNLKQGLFRLKDDAKAKYLYFGSHGFIGQHSGFGVLVMRVLKLEKNGIHIDDYLELQEMGSTPQIIPKSQSFSQNNSLPFSPGYGIIRCKL